MAFFTSKVSKYESVKQQKLEKRDRALARAEDILFPGSSLNDNLTASSDDAEILALSCSELVQRMTERSGKGKVLKAVRVYQAFSRQALRAHLQTNCLTEVFIDRGYAQAQLLDQEFERTGLPKGAFHGLPISLKDTQHVSGIDTSIGITGLANNPETSDGWYAAKLQEMGGVLFVKTNVPQTLLGFECGGTFWGAASNPVKTSFVPGGSSGGEAALLALSGSAFGIGSDIGGSLRIPAHYSGCFSLKPTSVRWITGSGFNPKPGFEGIPSTSGPMTRSIDDLQFIVTTMQNVLAQGILDAGDSGASPIWLRSGVIEELQSETRKLRVGYYLYDGAIMASPACQRAVRQTIDNLQSQGHQCTLLEPPHVPLGTEIFTALISHDGYKQLLSYCRINGDPLQSGLFLLLLSARIPNFLWYLASCILSLTVVQLWLGLGWSDSFFTNLTQASGKKSAYEYCAWVDQRDKYRDLWTAHLRNGDGTMKYDCIICPVQAVPAIGKGQSKKSPQWLLPHSCTTS